MRPLIYLDYDGVVLTSRAGIAQKAQSTDPIGRHADDPIAFGLLRRISMETGAAIVVTSTMRKVEKDVCIFYLEKHGLAPFLHEDLFTGDVNSRAAEIEAHLDNNGRPPFIIIDDERNDFTAEQIKRLVHTDMHFGLGVYDYGRALRLLGHPDGDPDEGDEPVVYQTPRLTIANHARAALAASRQGSQDELERLLSLIADHPLAQ
jgi:hypothetical protein